MKWATFILQVTELFCVAYEWGAMVWLVNLIWLVTVRNSTVGVVGCLTPQAPSDPPVWRLHHTSTYRLAHSLSLSAVTVWHIITHLLNSEDW